MTVNDKLITKVNAIDTCKFVLQTQYNTNKSGLKKIINGADKKVPHTSVLVKKTDYNATITDIEGRVHSITGLATTVALNTVENKIPNVSNLVKKTRLCFKNI